MLEVQGAGGFAWAALAEGSVLTQGAGAKRGERWSTRTLQCTSCYKVGHTEENCYRKTKEY